MNVKLLLNQHVRDHLNFQRGLLVLVFFLLTAFGAQAQTVTSDKLDYAPGEIAIITGSGWANDQYVDVHFEETPAYHEEHQHDYHGIAVDASGTWTIKYLIEDRHLGVAFDVHVVGKQSGATAHTYFTDKGHVQSINVTSSLNPSALGQNVTFTVTITGINKVTPTGKVDFKDGTTNLILNTELSKKNDGVATASYTTSSLPSGTRSITAIYSGDKNYNNATSSPFSQVVQSKEDQTITFNLLPNKTYGDIDFAPSATASSGLDVSYSSSNSSVATIVDGKIRIIGAGSATITASQAGNNSFNPAPDVTQILLVNTRSITVKASDNTKVYGMNLDLGTTAFTVDASTPMVAGESISSVTLSSAGATADANVNSYSITPSAAVAGSGTNLNNYNISFTNGTLKVSPATLTITAANASREYGAASPSFTGTYTGQKNGETFTVGGNSDATATSVVGDYAIVPTVSGSTLANYTVTPVNGTLKVSPATLTVATDAKTRVYGAANPDFTGTITGIVNGDNITATYASLADATSTVGSYAITATLSPASVLSNYEITNTASALTITKKELTVTADDKSKYCGQINPPLTVTYSGFVLGQTASVLTIAPTVSTTADRNSAVGTYDISADGGVAANFSFKYVSGKLTVNGLTVDASENSTPQALKTTATIVSIKLTGTSGIASAIPVTLYFNEKQYGPINSLADGSVTFDVGVLSTGVYKITAVAGAGCNESTVYLPVYDPNGGFITGGGWITSLRGSIIPNTIGLNSEAQGTASFGFVAKYKKGTSDVDGNTEFQFRDGNLNFKSSSHESASLVIDKDKATYRGSGTINGNSGFRFTVIATDSEVLGIAKQDKFRIRIWDSAGALVYDNEVNALNTEEYTQSSTTIGGGSIVIHQPTKSTSNKGLVAAGAIAPETFETTKFQNYPNPYNDRTTITFSSVKAENFALEVYDVKGALVRKVDMGVTEAGKTYSYEFESRTMPEGMYFARLITNSGVQTIKMVLKK